eukprot:scaffold135198_cov20-Tisochrysis_lutea.AAC.2
MAVRLLRMVQVRCSSNGYMRPSGKAGIPLFLFCSASWYAEPMHLTTPPAKRLMTEGALHKTNRVWLKIGCVPAAKLEVGCTRPTGCSTFYPPSTQSRFICTCAGCLSAAAK